MTSFNSMLSRWRTHPPGSLFWSCGCISEVVLHLCSRECASSVASFDLMVSGFPLSGRRTWRIANPRRRVNHECPVDLARGGGTLLPPASPPLTGLMITSSSTSCSLDSESPSGWCRPRLGPDLPACRTMETTFWLIRSTFMKSARMPSSNDLDDVDHVRVRIFPGFTIASSSMRDLNSWFVPALRRC